MSSSRDGGRTWSKAVVTHKISAIIKARVDQLTGKLYHFVSTVWMFPRFITVSSDQGLTWSPPIDVPQPGAQYAVHDGIFVVSAYGDPGINIHVSMDDGKTYTAVPLKDGAGNPVLGAPESGLPCDDPAPWITADPTQSKRFAVMVPRFTATRSQGFTPVWSKITFDKEYAFVSWVDVRSGETSGDVVVARVPSPSSAMLRRSSGQCAPRRATATTGLKAMLADA